jgi:hypothetical protein
MPQTPTLGEGAVIPFELSRFPHWRFPPPADTLIFARAIIRGRVSDRFLFQYLNR